MPPVKNEEKTRAIVAFRDADTALVLQVEGTPDFCDSCLTDSDFTENLLGLDEGLRPSAGVWIWEGSVTYYPGAGHTADDDGTTVVTGQWRMPNKSELQALKVGMSPWPTDNEVTWIDVAEFLGKGEGAFAAGSFFIDKVAEAKKLHCLAYLDFEEVHFTYITKEFVDGMLAELRSANYDHKYIKLIQHANLITSHPVQQASLRKWLQNG